MSWPMVTHCRVNAPMIFALPANRSQRSGDPTGRDRVAATKMGYLAVDLLKQGLTNRIVCTKDGGYTHVDMDEGLATHKQMQRMEMDVLDAMTGL